MNQKIFTRRFILLCISSLLFFCSFSMVIPKLYSFILILDGANYKLTILGAFTLVALFARPFSGKLTESIGRVPVMFFGSIVGALASLLYPLASSITFFILLRAFHGLSTGFKPTGSAAMVADIIPAKKRGEAMGYLGFMASTGMALGPFLGTSIFNNYGYNTMFFSSSFVAFLSVAVILNIKDTIPKQQKQKIGFSLLKLNMSDVVEPRVLFPAFIYLLYTISYGVIYNLATDYGEKTFLIHNIGYFFLILVLASMSSRLVAGRVSDKKGRVPVVLVGLAFLALSQFILGFSNTIELFYLGGAVLGFSVGILSPTIYAWVTDLSLADKKGRAFSTLYMALELGIFIGSVASSLIFNEVLSRIPTIILGSSVFSLLALVLIIIRWKQKNHKK